MGRDTSTAMFILWANGFFMLALLLVGFKLRVFRDWGYGHCPSCKFRDPLPLHPDHGICGQCMIDPENANRFKTTT
jgi:hypothetical protein